VKHSSGDTKRLCSQGCTILVWWLLFSVSFVAQEGDYTTPTIPWVIDFVVIIRTKALFLISPEGGKKKKNIRTTDAQWFFTYFMMRTYAMTNLLPCGAAGLDILALAKCFLSPSLLLVTANALRVTGVLQPIHTVPSTYLMVEPILGFHFGSSLHTLHNSLGESW
jgi:hypothetical protein